VSGRVGKINETSGRNYADSEGIQAVFVIVSPRSGGEPQTGGKQSAALNLQKQVPSTESGRIFTPGLGRKG